jgi:hypothetical protein
MRSASRKCGSTKPSVSVQIGHGRESAIGVIGKNAKDYNGTDGTAPRGKLPEILKRMECPSKEARARIASMQAAGTAIRSSCSMQPSREISRRSRRLGMISASVLRLTDAALLRAGRRG